MYFDAIATGKRIQKLRCDKKITQEQLAFDLNISDRHIRNLEKGIYTPSLDLFVEISVYFDVSLDYLILGALITPNERKLLKKIADYQQATSELANKLLALPEKMNL